MDSESHARRLGPAFAEEVRALLARRRISAVQLAKLMGVSQPYLSRRLNGAVAFDLDDIERIADVLNVDVLALLPTSAAASGPGLKEGKALPARKVEAHPIPRQTRGPFSGGRHDAARPVSAIPEARRRPQMIESAKRPKAV